MTTTKSRRKLKSMRIKGKVYDPMPRNPVCAPRVRSHSARASDARAFNTISLNSSNRKVKILKSGKKKITF